MPNHRQYLRAMKQQRIDLNHFYCQLTRGIANDMNSMLPKLYAVEMILRRSGEQINPAVAQIME